MPSFTQIKLLKLIFLDHSSFNYTLWDMWSMPFHLHLIALLDSTSETTLSKTKTEMLDLISIKLTSVYLTAILSTLWIMRSLNSMARTTSKNSSKLHLLIRKLTKLKSSSQRIPLLIPSKTWPLKLSLVKIMILKKLWSMLTKIHSLKLPRK